MRAPDGYVSSNVLHHPSFIGKSDHHCPWVDNCVGHFNYGHFIRFLFYVDVACSYHLAMLTKRVISGTSYWVRQQHGSSNTAAYYLAQDEPSGQELIFIVLNFATCIPVLLSVGIFRSEHPPIVVTSFPANLAPVSLYHFWYLLGNTTTIEGWEKDKVATLVRRGRIREVRVRFLTGPDFPSNTLLVAQIPLPLGRTPQHRVRPWHEPSPMVLSHGATRQWPQVSARRRRW